jgi:protein TonB
MEKADPGLKTVEGDPNALDPGIVEPDKGKGAVEEPKKESEVFTYVEQEPTFPGGEDAMMAFLGKNIKYPAQAKEAGIEGQVVVQFIVNEDGDISDVKVVRSVAGGCDAEAMRVVRSMPKWKPGKQNGRAVRVLYNLPIRFKLES